MRLQGAGRPGSHTRPAADTARDRHRPTSIASNATARTVAADLGTRLSDALASAGHDWRDELPEVGRTVRAGCKKALAITRKEDGAAWFDHASGAGGFVREDDSAAGLSAFELARMRQRARQQRKKNEAKRRAREHRAIVRARTTWAAAAPTTAHPYLETKGIAVVGLRVDRDGWLLVPRRDISGRFVGLQRIAPDGMKRYSAGTPARGTFFGLGTVYPGGTLLIAEGLATGATVHTETGHSCAVGFDAGNLRTVAELLRVKYPTVRIVLCADDDRQTSGNPGKAKATEAARAVGGAVAVPPLCRCCRCSDFNDLEQCVRRRGAA